MQTDPVCAMEVDEREAAGKSEYQGRAFYFCSEECKKEFDKNPERYVGRQAGGSGR